MEIWYLPSIGFYLIIFFKYGSVETVRDIISGDDGHTSRYEQLKIIFAGAIRYGNLLFYKFL